MSTRLSEAAWVHELKEAAISALFGGVCVAVLVARDLRASGTRRALLQHPTRLGLVFGFMAVGATVFAHRLMRHAVLALYTPSSPERKSRSIDSLYALSLLDILRVTLPCVGLSITAFAYAYVAPTTLLALALRYSILPAIGVAITAEWPHEMPWYSSRLSHLVTRMKVWYEDTLMRIHSDDM